MSTILATYPSKSNPAKSYNVVEGDDGVVYCTCPAWRMQGGDTNSRPPCKHIRDYHGPTPSGDVTKVKVVNHVPKSEDINWERRLQQASDELKGLMR